jgi:hypothetical protein
MSITRWAGDALQAYQAKWNEAVTAGLRPIDRMIADDSDRLSGVSSAAAPMLEAYAQGGWEHYTLREYGAHRRLLERLDPSGKIIDAYDGNHTYGSDGSMRPKIVEIYEKIKGLPAEEKTPTQYLASSIYQSAGKYGVKPENVKRMVDEGALPDSFLMTRGAQAARDLLSNPAAAYGLPAAGVGLAAWGIHDVMAAQQRAEKESQLPVSGGMQ